MAFTHSTLSVIVQPIGGEGMRFFSYRTDDDQATVTATDYFTNAARFGIRVSDLLFVSPVSTDFDPYILVIETVDAEGNATGAIADYEMVKSIYDPNGVASRVLFAVNNLDDVVDVPTARANLGLEIGVDVQAYSANLDAWSLLATSAKQDADPNLTTLSSGTTTLGTTGRALLEAETDDNAWTVLGDVTTARLADDAVTEAKVEDAFLATISRARDTDLTVQIPTDYATLQAAVDALGSTFTRAGSRIFLEIEDGHQLAAGLFVRDGDYSRFWITSAATPLAITDITQAATAVVTSAGHGLANGRTVYIDEVGGMTELNRQAFIVGGVTTDTFTLSYGDGSAVDSTGFTAYTSGGTATVPVQLDAAFVGVSDVGLTANDKTDNLIMGYNAHLPTLACLIDMQNLHDSGYYDVWGCIGFVTPHSGVLNAGYNALEWRTGTCTAHLSIWAGANGSGIRTAYTAEVAAQQSNCDDCCKVPDTPNQGAIDCSRTSTVHIRLMKARRSGGAGINTRRAARGTIEGSDFSNAADVGILWQGNSYGSGFEATANDCGSYGAWIRQGSLALNGGTFTGNTPFDIRIGDSSPHNSGVVADVSGATTTSGLNQIGDFSGVNNFNTPVRYGTAWNAAVTGPLQEINLFSATGVTSGKTFAAGGILDSSRAGGSTLPHQRFYSTGGEVGNISTTGSGTIFNETSDGRLKINRAPLSEETDVGALIDALEPIAFDWLSGVTGEPTGKRGRGFIAQDLYSIHPSLASPPENDDGTASPGDEVFEPWQMSATSLVVYLVAELKLLRSRVASLENSSSKGE